MSKFEQYNIPLKDLKDENLVFNFILDDDYFKRINSPEVQHGNVKAKVIVSKKSSLFELVFNLDGIIVIPCDRCLDDMNQAIQYKEKIEVKFGNSFSEEGDIVVIPESDGAINIAWFLYEFIVLNIPLKHVHPIGECNKTMVNKLKKHTTKSKSEDDDSENTEDLDFEEDNDISLEETSTDPRWNSLQNIFDNN